jgi:hypothetical protein
MRLGENTIGTVKLGEMQVQRVYLGENLVWQNAPVAIAATGISDTSFTANWNAYTGAIYYLLDVSLSSSFSTFVLENQIVLTNSYVVTGLSSGTTYYYRVRASDDSDISGFFDRVTTAGGSLTNNEKIAIVNLVQYLKDYGIWTKMKAVYPMVGASAAACAQNLKSSSFTGTFTSGWTFASTGVTPNGSSAFMNTAFNPNTECASANVGGLGIYSRTSRAGNPGRTQGVLGSPSYFGGWVLYNATSTYGAINDATGGGLATTTSQLFWQVARNNSATQLLQGLNGEVSTLTQAATLKANANVYFGAANSAGVATNFDTLEIALCYLSGDALSSTNLQNMYTAVQAFQTTLSRQV